MFVRFGLKKIKSLLEKEDIHLVDYSMHGFYWVWCGLRLRGLIEKELPVNNFYPDIIYMFT